MWGNEKNDQIIKGMYGARDTEICSLHLGAPF